MIDVQSEELQKELRFYEFFYSQKKIMVIEHQLINS